MKKAIEVILETMDDLTDTEIYQIEEYCKEIIDKRAKKWAKKNAVEFLQVIDSITDKPNPQP